MEVILTVEHFRKHFSDEPVLIDVSFQLRAGDKTGLVGPNGCGKTTLLNILAGREESEKGSIDAPGIKIGYLEQRPDTTSDKTMLEEAKTALAPLIEMQNEAERIAHQLSETKNETELNRLAVKYDRIHELLMRHDAYQLDHRIEKILHGVGFQDNDLGKPVSALSGGEMNRLSLAKLLLEEPDVMLLDEPSNHLDLLATEWLETFLRETSASVILVSHDRYFLDRVTNRTFELFHGTIDDYPGNFSKYTLLKEERLAVQTRTYEKYIEEVEKSKEFIRRNHYGMKAAQAEDRRKKLERLMETPAALPKKIETPPMNFPKPSRTGDIVFRCEDLTKGFVADKPLFQNLTVNIERGQRWAILGPNGCGKTTLLRCLLNELKPDSGTVIHGQGLKIGYFDQQLHVLDDSVPVVDAIRPAKKIFEEPARRNLLGAFGLTGEQQLQTVGSLSGGQRCRAALAKLSAEDANVLILDEPTNHLDLWARAALEKAIRDFEGTVLFISHDRYFVDKVADHLLIIQENAQFKVLEGNYSTFRMMVSQNLMTDPFSTSAASNRKAAAGTGKSMVPAQQKKQPQHPQKQQPQHQQKKVPLPPSDRHNRPPKESVRAEENWKQSQGRPEKSKEEKPKRERKFPYRKVSDIEEEIFARETHILSLNEDLLNPGITRDGERVKAIHLEIKEEQEKIAQLYEHWEEATELNW